jgi:hypothetical protein
VHGRCGRSVAIEGRHLILIWCVTTPARRRWHNHDTGETPVPRGRLAFSGEAEFAAAALEEPGGGAPAFAVGDYVHGFYSRLQAGEADALGKRWVAADSVIDGAAGDADGGGGLGNRAAEPQNGAKLVFFGIVENDRTASGASRYFGGAGRRDSVRMGHMLFLTNLL